MKLGFVSAILSDLSLQQVMQFAAAEGFDCVELMCWPAGKADRRYAGVTHLDASDFGPDQAERVRQIVRDTGVEISGLGYYPNPLAADREESERVVEHLKKVIRAASLLGLTTVNTFIGRDPRKSVEENWPRLMEVWPPIVKLAEESGVRIGIENCPMLFSADEWPGGKNLAVSPAIWRRIFSAIPSESLGLNYDPSHLVWQQIDYLKPLREFGGRIFHVHAKDTLVERGKLDDVGILALPSQYQRPKLPGLGEIDWNQFLRTLREVGYEGPVCVEVEDRDYEQSLDRRKTALRESLAHLRKSLG